MAVTVAEPLLPPLHKTFADAEMVAVGPLALVTMTDAVAVHPLASVTVTV